MLKKSFVDYSMAQVSLVPDTCYICLEECHESSPCQCQATVHQTCLEEYRSKSANENCTICQGPLRLTPCTIFGRFVLRCVQSCIVGIFGGIFAYIACGFLGIYVWTGLGLCECIVFRASFVETLSTPGFVYSSFSMMVIIAMGFRCLHVWMHNYMSRRRL